LLGWAVLGWIAAQIWAIVEKIEYEEDFDQGTGLPRERMVA
jgi:hypothetical protein